MPREVESSSATAFAALCGDVIDYAGTFPPAELSLASAVERYARYRSGADAWMLNRFVVSARDLPAFERARTANAAPADDATNDTPWPLSVVCGAREDIDRASKWRSELATVASVELTTSAASTLSDPECEVFVEHPLEVSRQHLEQLGKRNAMLKIRLGGRSTPPSSAVARILSTCAELRLPLKATAGLHRAMRSESHGFLNLLLGATLAHRGGALGEIESLLEETEATSFGFVAGSIVWRAHRFDVEMISEARDLFRSFGSCSFEEPLESLEALELKR